jgi:hypothetical protein
MQVCYHRCCCCSKPPEENPGIDFCDTSTAADWTTNCSPAPKIKGNDRLQKMETELELEVLELVGESLVYFN